MTTDRSMQLFQQACGGLGSLAVTVGHTDGRPPEHREFVQPFLVIGRDAKAGLPLADVAVSYRHVLLQVIEGNVFCLDLGSRDGVRWGDSLRPSGWIGPDQVLGVGPFTIQVPNAPTAIRGDLTDPLTSRPPSQDPLPPITLEILLDNQTVVWPMNRVLALVGQDPRCKIHLKAKGVSAIHCSLVRTPQGLWVVDLTSSTGTRVNGRPVRWAPLGDGDELGVGEMRIRVIHPASRTPAPATPSAEEGLRLQVDELTRALAAAEEDRAGLIRSGEEVSARWEAERQTLTRQLESEAQVRAVEQAALTELRAQFDAERKRAEADLAALRAQAEAERSRLATEVEALRKDSTAQRVNLEAEFRGERQSFQDRITSLLGEATTWEQRHREHVARADGNLDRERRALRDDADRVRREAEAARAEAVDRERELATLRQDRDASAALVAALTLDRDRAAARLAASETELSLIRAEAEAYDQRHAHELTAVRDELERVRAASGEEAEALRRECQAVTSLAEVRLRQLTALQADAESQQHARSQAVAHSGNLARQIAELRADHDRDREALRAERDGVAKRLRHREEEWAAAQAEMNELKQATEDRAAQLDAAHTAVKQAKQAHKAEVDALRAELTAARQTGQTDSAAMQTAVAAEVETLRRDAKSLRTQLSAERSLVANLQTHRQTLQDEAVALRQENETLQNRLETQEHAAQLTALAPNPTLAALTDRFQHALERYAGLVEQVDDVHARLRERAQRTEGRRSGMLGRLLGGESREEREETEAALERRLAALQADAAVEQEKAALAAAEAVRADLERQLAEARRQLAALQVG